MSHLLRQITLDYKRVSKNAGGSTQHETRHELLICSRHELVVSQFEI